MERDIAYRCASHLPIPCISIGSSWLGRLVHTTVSVTKGVGVQPRGGVRSSEGWKLEKDRAAEGRKNALMTRGAARPRRWGERIERILST